MAKDSAAALFLRVTDVGGLPELILMGHEDTIHMGMHSLHLHVHAGRHREDTLSLEGSRQ